MHLYYNMFTERKTSRKHQKIRESFAKKLKNWKGRTISTTAMDIVQPRTSDMPQVIEEVKDNLEVTE
jgi:hypothetical protein